MANLGENIKNFCKRSVGRYCDPRRVYSSRGKLENSRKRVELLRKRIATELPFEHFSQSPFADQAIDDGTTIIATKDRYGFAVRLALCHQTGLLYLVDRLTPDAYSQFYEEGLYRELVAAFWGSHYDNKNDLVTKQHKAAEANAQLVVQAVKNQLFLPENATMLDVGGSTGALASAFVEEFGVRATVLDPAKEELALAAARGLPTKLGLLEQVNFSDYEKFDLITLNQTIEHIIDIRDAFNRMRRVLNPNGYLIFDMLDFIAMTQLRGCAQAVSQLDHCHFFYDEMVDVFCRRVGLNIKKKVHHAPLSMLYICQKNEPDLRARLPEGLLQPIIRRFITQDVRWEATPNILQSSFEERLIRWIMRQKNKLLR